MFKQNTKYEVLTPSGWKDFDGVNRVRKKGYLNLEFDNGKKLTCTKEHKIDTVDGYKEAEHINEKDIVLAKDDSTKLINKEFVNKSLYFYDLFNVQDERHRFYANDLIISNCAFISHNLWEEFYRSVYPTISSGKQSKLILTSTANGYNHFYKIWMDSINKKNDFANVCVTWKDVPGRDNTWKEETIRNTSEEAFMQEQECVFLGSSNTLIPMGVLQNLVYIDPLKASSGLNKSYEGLKIYQEPIKVSMEEKRLGKEDAMYVLIADTAEGVGGDYSAFSVFRIDTIPYEQVCVFRNNFISPQAGFPELIHKISKYYNDAAILLETNSVGMTVSDILYRDLENENLIATSMRGRKGQIITGGFKKNSAFGVRTTTQVKRIGCSALKDLMMADKLRINDYDTIREMSTFVRKKNSYEADDGSNDDLMMTLVLFGWLTQQQYFKDLNSLVTRERIFAKQIEEMEEELMPFGFFGNFLDQTNENTIVENGLVWTKIK